MTAHSLAKRRSVLRRFARDPKGVSAVEFAIVLPFMVALYLGTIELGNGLAVKFKATLAVRTVTDLASQFVSIDTSTMSTILNAASTVMTPYPTLNMAITLSEITTNASGQGYVTWSCSLGGTARTWSTSGTTGMYTLPTNLQTANITVLLGEVAYPYTPNLGYVVTGTINLNQSLYFYPRLSSTITGPGTTVSSCPTS
jgi:Flp pilus assembly protein TadG